MPALLALSLAAATLVAATSAGPSTSTISATCASDFSSISRGTAVGTGCSLRGMGCGDVVYLRTGNPKAVSSVVLKGNLTAGAEITGISFSYSYLAGFGPNGTAANFSVQVPLFLAHFSLISDLSLISLSFLSHFSRIISLMFVSFLAGRWHEGLRLARAGQLHVHAQPHRLQPTSARQC